jgi:lipid-binding SYLF domain-containing protein
MSAFRNVAAGLFTMALLSGTTFAADEAVTVDMSETVLKEVMAIPAKRIPSDLLAKAQGVAIIPNVIKIGFIGGIRRGHGVLLVKDKEGDWSLPEFITLTGGSLGWQAGAQSTDVVLVFKSSKGVENIRKGTFTIGADAAAAAGPVGRNAAAATDTQMNAEILSYSRSRGLFAGVSLDGSNLEIDHRSNRDFYGEPGAQPARPIPAAVVKLMQSVAALTNDDPKAAVAGAAPDVDRLRRDLAQSARTLNGVLSADWQKFLALPAGVYGTQEHPPLDALANSQRNYDRVANEAAYAHLRARHEFQATHELLREYVAALSKSNIIQLPPPPTN